jgi:hypothetical protein
VRYLDDRRATRAWTPGTSRGIAAGREVTDDRQNGEGSNDDPRRVDGIDRSAHARGRRWRVGCPIAWPCRFSVALQANLLSQSSVEEIPMTDEASLKLLDHALADDELAWMKAVYEDFGKLRASFSGRESAFDPKEALREVLGREQHRLPGPMDLSGPGPWRNGRNRHGRLLAAVFLPRVELHKHAKSRTDQFPMYVVGEADAFSLGEGAEPVLTPVIGGDHFHNSPDAPHAFVPKVGKPVPENWEIAFIAITPRNLKEDTQAVSEDVRAAYKRAVGIEAPLGV